jgi:tetratricopeptide (TPR) repeat protein
LPPAPGSVRLPAAVQLDLFSDWLVSKRAADAAGLTHDPDGKQLDLFGARSLRMTQCLRALHEFELERACSELEALVRQYPGDRSLADALALASRLADKRARVFLETGDPIQALAALEVELTPHLEVAWHRQLAQEAERLSGEGSLAGIAPAGFHWLVAGQVSRAERSLRATLSRWPENARARAYLADVLFVQGETERSRRQYVRAFSEAPLEVDLERLLDPEVRRLPEIARSEFAIAGNGTDWVSALGMVRGVFALPDLLLPGLADPATARDPLPGLEFLVALRHERRARSLDDRVAARRVMKRLCAPLFAEYLERFGG